MFVPKNAPITKYGRRITSSLVEFHPAPPQSQFPPGLITPVYIPLYQSFVQGWMYQIVCVMRTHILFIDK